MQRHVLILAAGLGTRMKSKRPKVVHELGGKPLITYGLRAAVELQPWRVWMVVGHGTQEVQEAVTDAFVRLYEREGLSVPALDFVVQAEQLGTGHAVKVAGEALRGMSGTLVVYYGDVPLIRPETLQQLVQVHEKGRCAATALTVRMDDPTGYGRIVRNEEGAFVRIVEHRDATPEERAIQEVNAGVYCFQIKPLLAALDRLTPQNAQGEYYLPDVFTILQQDRHRVGLFEHDDPNEVRGINTRVELAEIEAIIRRRTLEKLMLDGVTIVDPNSTYISQDAVIGPDTVIHPQVIIEGDTTIGEGCQVHSWSRIVNSTVGDAVQVKNSCIIVDSHISTGAKVGPFAHLRMGAELGERAAIGNFVEVKKSKIGPGTKAMHLTYLGDATVGNKVNVGAGTITCNYDGKQKHPTFIEDDVKLGSDTMLVAPVRVGRGAMTGAGAVVTKDIPEDSLAVGIPAVVKKKLK
jgi:bifunctional UDP-N-acetylglucosamine pyrophosphorylase/glucosamine-1-phosphate N-acetyltransferase